MKIITVETLKAFLDELNKKYGTEFYSKVEADTTFQRKGESGGAGVDAFYKWLKERNYDLTNFRGLEDVFPVKDFPEIKVVNLAGGDTQIAGTGAPYATVEYEGKQVQIGGDCHFVLDGITPLVDGDFVQIICYDYAGRKKTFLFTVGNVEYAVPEGTTEITEDTVEQYNLNRAGRLIFPPSVKSVENYAFSNCSLLTSVSMPLCTSVGGASFGGCSSLTNVSLPSCTSVGISAFEECKKLTSVSLPSCTQVADDAFHGCSSLTNVSFPACTQVSDNVFRDCSSLTNATLPACTSVGRFAFGGCASLASISLPACTQVGQGAFVMCEKLASVNLPVCTSIGEMAFQMSSPQNVIFSDKWKPFLRIGLPHGTNIYNPDKTKKVDWNTMSWVNV